MLQRRFNGLSGNIEFDENGFRKNYWLDILNMEKKRPPEKVIYADVDIEHIVVNAAVERVKVFC